MAIFPFAAMSVVFHQTSIFAERGLSATVTAGAFVPYSVALAIAALAAGVIVDRVGPKRVFVADMALVVGGLLIVRFWGSTGAATALLLGTALGIFLLLQNVIWTHFYGRRGLGRAQGAAVMIGISASALGPFAMALLHRQGGNYDLGLSVMAALPLLAVALMAFARTQRAPARAAFARAGE